MPFGFRSAKDKFQRKIDEIIEGLQGIATLLDDILVYGKTRAKHDANLPIVLEAILRKRGQVKF